MIKDRHYLKLATSLLRFKKVAILSSGPSSFPPKRPLVKMSQTMSARHLGTLAPIFTKATAAGGDKEVSKKHLILYNQ